jgi:hypothetical protein
MYMIGLLLVLVLILAGMVGLVVYVVIWCLGLCLGNRVRSRPENGFVFPRSQDEKTWNSDLHQQMQLDQQWLFSQLLSQGHDESQSNDLFDTPTDWWE